MGNSLSILHRLSGIFLILGFLALCYWLMSIAGGAAPYSAAMAIFTGPLGILVLCGWTFAFFFHLLNGIRHLFWDTGRGFEATQRRVSGWLVVAGSVALSLSVGAWIWYAGAVR
jgi:succinate dehydrogenase / fumarate reductase cytochrome b subunit